MMYLIIIFISPLYFLIRGKIGGLILNAIIYCLALAFLVTIIFSWVGVMLWILAVGHAVWHYKRDLMTKHAEMIVNRVTAAQVKGQIVQQRETHVDPIDTKKCPMCAETIKYEARVCKHCGYKFSEDELNQQKSERDTLIKQVERDALIKQDEYTPTNSKIIPILVILIIVIGTGLLLYQSYEKNRAAQEQPQIQKQKGEARAKQEVHQEDLRQEVEKISEKIRSAHINKDINKWLGCYHSAFPNLGRVENQMLELWKNYDIKEVSYRISNVQRVSDKGGSANILWNIQLYDHRTHDYTLVRQKYQTTLEKGRDGWKIRDAKEVAGD